LQVTLYSGVSALVSNATSANFTTSAPGQAAYVSFSATAGGIVDFAFSSISLVSGSPNYVTLTFYEPSGTYYWSTTCSAATGCMIPSYGNMPVSGTWTIQVTPAATSQTMSFTATVSTPVQLSLTPSNQATINMNAIGQAALASFTATAGQNLALTLSGASTSPAGVALQANVYHSNGTLVTYTTFTSGTTLNLSNLSADTYEVFIFPATPVTTTLQATIN
jgi:hypothetical protein